MRESSVSPGTGLHPDLDRWIAYHGGELLESEEDRLRSHLAVCRTCVSTILDLEAFNSFDKPGADDLNAVSEFEMAAAWRAMKAVLPGEECDEKPLPSSSPSEQVSSPPRPTGWRSRVPVPMTLAASFLVAALGLSLWGAFEHQSAKELRAQLATRSTPQANLAIRDLEPNMVTRSGNSSNPTVLRQGEFSALVMLPSELLETYDVEILDAAGNEVWSGSGLVPDAQLGTLALGLPPGFLRSGSYRLRLSGGDPKVVLGDDLSIEVQP